MPLNLCGEQNSNLKTKICYMTQALILLCFLETDMGVYQNKCM